MASVLEQLEWESFKKMMTDDQLLYKGLKGKARIPTNDLILKTGRCRNTFLYSLHDIADTIC